MEVSSLLLGRGRVPFLTLDCVRLLTAIRKEREESPGSCSQPGFLQGISCSSSVPDKVFGATRGDRSLLTAPGLFPDMQNGEFSSGHSKAEQLSENF